MMTNRSWALLALAVFLLPTVAAHAAPGQRDFETRLMHDCIDDRGHGISTGYDIHSLDVWEFWDGAQEMAGFRLILSGGGDVIITLSFDEGGSSKEYGWVRSSDTWSGTGFAHAERRDDVDDGDRFALVGLASMASLGGRGAVLSDFLVESDGTLIGDSMPGNNGTGSCEGAFERPDYTLGENDVERAYLGKIPDEQTIELLADNEHFFDVTMYNKISSLKQRVTLEIIDTAGEVTAEFHTPGGDYAKIVDLELDTRDNVGTSPRLIHLALNAPTGASGSVTIQVTSLVVLKDGTTQPGAHIVRTLEYHVQGADVPEAPTPPPSEGDEPKGSPAPSLVVACVALLAAAFWHRR